MDVDRYVRLMCWLIGLGVILMTLVFIGAVLSVARF